MTTEQKSLGQVAHEQFMTFGPPRWRPWGELSDAQRANWETVAQAVVDAFCGDGCPNDE